MMGLDTARAGELFDYSVVQPEGYEAKQAEDELQWTHAQFTRAVRQLRRILGSDDEINLICTNQGFGAPMLYQLVGDIERAGPWVTTRLRALESQLETVHSVAASLARGTDGRTVQGKKARLIHRYVGRLREDLGDLDGQLPIR